MIKKEKTIKEVFTNYGYIDIETVTQDERTGKDTGKIEDVKHFVDYLNRNNILFSLQNDSTEWPTIRYEATFSVIRKLLIDQFDKSQVDFMIKDFVKF